MTKYADSQYNRYAKLKQNIVSWYDHCIHFGYASDALIDKIQDVKAQGGFNKLNPFYQGCISGYCDARYDDILRNKLVYQMEYQGVWYPNDKIPCKPSEYIEYLTTKFNYPNCDGSVYSRFVWAHNSKIYR